MFEYIAIGFIGAMVGALITMFIVAVNRNNREHDIYIEGYIAGTKAKKNEDRFGVKECNDYE